MPVERRKNLAFFCNVPATFGDQSTERIQEAPLTGSIRMTPIFSFTIIYSFMRTTYLVLFAILFIIGGVDRSVAQSHERTVQDTLSFDGRAVAVENKEGSISISTWDRDAVAYEARIVSGQSADVVEQAAIDVETFNQRLSLFSNFEAIEAEWSFGPEIFGYGVSHPDVHYTITLPKAAELSIEDHESQIEVEGHAASLEIDTHEGAVEVLRQRGPVKIEAHEGAIDVTDVQGDFVVDTHEGTLTAEALRGDVRIGTHEGRADVAMDSLGSVEVNTHEGRITVSLPADAGFDLSTDLGSDARMRGDVDLQSLRADENNYRGRVQGGGPLFHATSHEGEIVLLRR